MNDRVSPNVHRDVLRAASSVKEQQIARLEPPLVRGDAECRLFVRGAGEGQSVKREDVADEPRTVERAR